MIQKIVSGGQTGADLGALDAAIRLGIPHGGWIPKGRKTEKGVLPARYKLREMPTSGYPERTERNVVDSDGTVILAHGRLTGGSELTRKMAIQHGRPWIYIDLSHTTKFEAAMVLSKWVRSNRIGVLNVAGPRESHDPHIYEATTGIIESAFFLLQMSEDKTVQGQPPGREFPVPGTVEEAVSRLSHKLSLRDRTAIANMSIGELGSLQKTLGEYIRNAFGFDNGNDKLMASCRFVSKKSIDSREDAVRVILRSLWDKLRETHKLRIIK